MKSVAFDIDRAFDLICDAVAPYPKAALFDLYDQGFTTTFQILVACIISIRTYDETTIPAAHSLFALADTPQAMRRLSAEEIAAAICQSTFAKAKGEQILEIAQRAVEEFGGEIPCSEETLLSFHGVGPKCANLVLGIVCGQGKISVDIHVHRITNRWGYVATTTPEKTMKALERKLPEHDRVRINQLLVPFGKHICTGTLPHCSTCPVLKMCAQVGVTKHR